MSCKDGFVLVLERLNMMKKNEGVKNSMTQKIKLTLYIIFRGESTIVGVRGKFLESSKVTKKSKMKK